jgi:hypothetical protein
VCACGTCSVFVLLFRCWCAFLELSWSRVASPLRFTCMWLFNPLVHIFLTKSLITRAFVSSPHFLHVSQNICTHTQKIHTQNTHTHTHTRANTRRWSPCPLEATRMSLFYCWSHCLCARVCECACLEPSFFVVHTRIHTHLYVYRCFRLYGSCSRNGRSLLL